MQTRFNKFKPTRQFRILGETTLILMVLAAAHTTGQQTNAPPAPVVEDAIVESSTSIFLRWTVDTDSGVTDQEIIESRITWQAAGSQDSESLDVTVDDTNCEDISTYPIRCSATLTGLGSNTSYDVSLSARGVVYASGTSTIETDYGFGDSSAAITRQTHGDFDLADPVLAGIEKQARIPFVRLVSDNSEAASDSLEGLFTFLSERGSDTTNPSNPHLWDYTATISPANAARLSIVIDFDSRVEDDLFRIIGTYVDSESTTARATVTATSKADSSINAERDVVFTVVRNRAPVFGVTAATFEMAEDDPYPIEIGNRFNLSDADDHTLSYSLETVSPEDEIFEIDPDTGTIDLKDGEVLDYETATQHVLHVTAIDSVGAESNILKITIDVLNVDEEPTGPSDAVDMGVLEHQSMGFDEDWVNFHVREYFYDPDEDPLCFDAEISKGSSYATVSVSSSQSGCGLPHIQVRRVDMVGLYEVKEVEVEITATEDVDDDPGSVSATVAVSIAYGENTKPSILGGKLPSAGSNSAYLQSYDAGTESSFDMIFTALDTLPRLDRVCFTLGGEDADLFKIVDVDNPNQLANCDSDGSNSTLGSLNYSHQIRVQSLRALERSKSDPHYSFDLIATDLSGYADSLDFKITTDNIWTGLFSNPMPDAHFLAGDDSEVYTLSDYFEHDEPDEEASLTFEVSSGNVDLVEVYEANGELTLTPTRTLDRNRASTYVTVTAEDSYGFATRERFDVHVRQDNSPPRIERVTRSYTIAEDLPVAQYFSKAPHAYDSDDDEISFRLADADWPFGADANTGLITILDRLDFETAASYLLTLYAEDDFGGSDSVQISVELTDVNEPPIPTAVVIDDTETIVGLGLQNDLFASDHFSDPDAGDSITITAYSSRSKVATAEIDADGYVVVEGIEPGETTITVEATDTGDPPLTSSKSFLVKVLENQAPTLGAPIADINVIVDADKDVELDGVFEDEAGDIHTYSASSSDASVVDTSVEESTLTLTGKSEGTAQVTITVSDAANNAAQTRVWVHVNENQQPIVVQEIADLKTRVGRVVEISLLEYFQDEGDTLAFEIELEDSDLAEADLQSDLNVLHITALAEGETTCTVTATDSLGESVSEDFAITILEKNDPPVVARQLEDIELSLESHVRYDVDIEGVFDDEKPDQLSIDVESSTEEYADVILRNNGTEIRIYPLKRGDFEITVTATDDVDQSTSTDFHVAILDEEINTPPEVSAPIADHTIDVGEELELDLASVYTDAEGDELTFTAESDDEDVATVGVDESNLLTVEGISAGTATITTEATDPSGESATDTFKVTVKTVPVASQTVAQITLQLGGAGTSLDLNDSFYDADGDPLAFKITDQDANIANAYIEEATLSLDPLQRGAAVVTVIATDPDGNAAEGRFNVVVSDEAIKNVARNALSGYGRSLLTSIAATIADQDRHQTSSMSESLRNVWNDFSRQHRSSYLTNPLRSSSLRTGTGLADNPWNASSDGPGQTFTKSPTASLPNYSVHTSGGSTSRRIGLWSKTDSSNYGGIGFNGEATNRYLGFDIQSQSSGYWGVALLKSKSANTYTYGSASEELQTAVSSVLPYFRHQIGMNYQVWGALGFGKGRATISSQGTEIGGNTLLMKFGMIGVRRTLLDSRSNQVAIMGDVGSLELATKGAGPSSGLQSRSHRLRVAMSGSVTKHIGTSQSITPFGRFGLRYDDGDNPIPTGWEIAGGMRYSASFLKLEAQGVLFKVPKTDAHYERSLSVSATYDKNNDGLGFTFAVAPSIGCPRASSGIGTAGPESPRSFIHFQDSCNDQRALETSLGHTSYIWNGQVRVNPRTTLRYNSYQTRHATVGIRLEYESLRTTKGSLELQLKDSDSPHQSGLPELVATGRLYF